MSSKSRPVLDPDVVGPNPYPLGLSYPAGTPPTRIDWHRGRSGRGIPSSFSRVSLTTGEAGRRWFEQRRGPSGPDVAVDPARCPLLVAALCPRDLVALVGPRHMAPKAVGAVAPPITAVGLRLSDEAIRVAVAHRLGCKACELHTCVCGKPVDVRGLHGLSCHKSPSGR